MLTPTRELAQQIDDVMLGLAYQTKVRGGIIVPAIGRFNVYHDSNINLTTLRPLINQFIVPTAYRDAGIGLRGRFKLPFRWKLSYEADVVNAA